MTTHRLTLFITLVTIAAAAGMGCGTNALRGVKRYQVYHSPTFTYESVGADGIGIGWVTSTSLEDTSMLNDEAQLAGRLRGRIIEKREDLQVATQGQVRASCGDKMFDEVATEFRKTGALAPETIAQLRESADSGPRYVILARVETDYTYQNSSTNRELVDGEWVDGSIDYTTARDVLIGFRVLDTVTGSEVWRSELKTTGKNKNTEHLSTEPKEKKERSLLGSVGHGLVGWLFSDDEEDDSSPHPVAPDSHALVNKIFDDFAGQLPKATD